MRRYSACGLAPIVFAKLLGRFGSSFHEVRDSQLCEAGNRPRDMDSVQQLEYTDMRGRALALFRHSWSPGFRFLSYRVAELYPEPEGADGDAALREPIEIE